MKTRQSTGGGLIDTIKDFGGKILNRTIDILPVELHLPTFQWCGPGTKVQERLRRGDPGINKLDAACKQHDIAYFQSTDSKRRAEADRILAEQAWQRVKASDASATEKAAAWAVTNLMKLKSKFGGGGAQKQPRKQQRRRRKRRKQQQHGVIGQGLYLRNYKGRGLQVRKKKTSTRCRRVR